MRNYDTKVDIMALMYSYYIRYDKLKELTDLTLGVDPNYCNSNVVNVYIDIYDMLLPYYRTDYKTDKKYTIVSAVINLAAHMRDYYYTRHGVLSKIYLIYGDGSTPSHRQFIHNFGSSPMHTIEYDKINEIIQTQLELIKIICGYIDGVYFMKRTAEFAVVAYDEINKESIAIPAVVISKSPYAYQLPAILDNCVLLRPSKHNGTDTSFAVTNTNAIRSFCKNVNSEKTIQKINMINSNLLSVIMVMNGIDCKNVHKITNITTAINKICTAIEKMTIINGYNTDTDYLYNNLDISQLMDPMTFKYRFNAIDLVFQHRLYTNSAESKDITHMVDLSDKLALHQINNTYFMDNPLNLDAL